MSVKEDLENRKRIIELLKDRKDLIVSTVFNHKYEDVKFIYEREEWNNPKFKNLLMPYIWRRTPKEVEDILTLPEWNNPKYEKLLVHNIWLYPSDVTISKIRILRRINIANFLPRYLLILLFKILLVLLNYLPNIILVIL